MWNAGDCLVVLGLGIACATTSAAELAEQAGNEFAIRLLKANKDLAGAASTYERLLKDPTYEENDPQRMRWLEKYAEALYAQNDLAGARNALGAALQIMTALGDRGKPIALSLLGPLAVVEYESGRPKYAAQYCAEIRGLGSSIPRAQAQFVAAVGKACPGLALPVEPALGPASGNWARATAIAKQLGIEDALEDRIAVSRAVFLANLYLGDAYPVKLSTSWEVPLERAEADTIAVFLAAKHKTNSSGAFVPVGVQRAVIFDALFVEKMAPLPPQPVPDMTIHVDDVHFLVVVLLHEVSHALSNDQASYPTATCAQRREMERRADEFVAKTLRSALLGDVGHLQSVAALRTVQSVIVLGWNFTVHRSMREMFPKSLPESDYRRVLTAAYCGGGPAHGAMELRLLREFETMLGPEYRQFFKTDGIKPLITDFESVSSRFPSCQC